MIYGFEVRSIQSYILRSGKLKDMVGASELVNSLTGDLLKQTLKDLGLKEGTHLTYARRAGGALTIFFEQPSQAEDFRDLWTLRVQKRAPGLLFKNALVPLSNGVKAAWETLRLEMSADQNRPPANLPLSGPLIKRYIRTGVVATESQYNKPDENIFLDAATHAKRHMQKEDLADRFTPKDWQTKAHWPKILVAEEGDDDNESALLENREDGDYLALIHADGNGLGQLLGTLKDELPDDPKVFAKCWYAFSKAVDHATARAVQMAIGAVVKDSHIVQGKSVMPIRPLILGGDDLTLLIHSELALLFTETFLKNFENTTREELANLTFNPGVDKLTACAGIVFLKPKMPFHQVNRLCESLCTAAKKKSKKHLLADGHVPGSLIFHRLTAGFIDNWPDIVDGELTTPDGQFLTMQPYSVADQPVGQIPALSDFLEFARVLNKTSRGAARELARLAAAGDGHMARALKRWQENMKKDDQGDLLDDLRVQLQALTKKDGTDSPALFSEDGRSPLADALILRAIGGGEHATQL